MYKNCADCAIRKLHLAVLVAICKSQLAVHKKAVHKNVDEINPRLPLERVGLYPLSIDNIMEHQTEFIPETSGLKSPTDHQQKAKYCRQLPSRLHSQHTQLPLTRTDGKTSLYWPSKKEKAYYSNFVYTRIVKKQ